MVRDLDPGSSRPTVGFAWTGAVVPLVLSLACVRAAGDVDSSSPDRGVRGPVGVAVAADGGPIFVDEAEAVGLDFVHDNGMTGELFMVEMVGSGAALIDYDNDGDLDLYLVQSGALGSAPAAASAAKGRSDRLFRNDLIASGRDSGRLFFVDVSEIAGLAAVGYGQGVAVADYDGDGWLDLYVTNYGPNQMLRNNGDGTFADVTAHTGTAGESWSTSATFLDYDSDGWPDLFVGNYLDATLDNHFNCTSESGLVDYCGPLSFEPLQDVLYRNRGDGTFEDVTAVAGVGLAGAALGVVSADLDADGRVDIYVANDQMPNYLWHNRGDGTFVDRALISGCAVNREGKAEASMGVDAADFDGDGDVDVFLTHLRNETNTLYLNEGVGMFRDATPMTGLGPRSLPFTSFGMRSFDYDNDGWLDVLVLNGTVRRLEEQMAAGKALPLEQPNQLFHGLGGGRYEDVSAAAGAAVTKPSVSRGGAFGDVDNDGDPDVVVVNNSAAVQLLRNRMGHKAHWLGLRLVEGVPARDAIGARAVAVGADGRATMRRAYRDGGFLSAHDPRIVFGLGAVAAETLVSVRVIWPDGVEEEFHGLEVDGYTTLVRGAGEPPRESG